jgi:hypothetical protein
MDMVWSKSPTDYGYVTGHGDLPEQVATPSADFIAQYGITIFGTPT